MIKLKDIFFIEYGSQLDLNKLEKFDKGINFVSRKSTNLGVECKIEKISNKKIFKKGSITVTLGGEYLLSSFVQQEDFYTAQNIKVLTPKEEMLDIEKKFYCYVIEFNRFKYYSHGREANKTLDDIVVPSKNEIPKWVYETKIPSVEKSPILQQNIGLNTNSWKSFEIKTLFNIVKGKEQISNTEDGDIPLISSTATNNGITKYINNGEKLFYKNKITVASNGSVGETFYQSEDFYATSDVNVLTPKFEMNSYIAMFFVAIIRNEKYKFDYGRKWGKDRMENSIIKLPMNTNNNPDFEFMENYIKSLEYSKNL